jgi:hypothetical protein
MAIGTWDYSHIDVHKITPSTLLLRSQFGHSIGLNLVIITNQVLREHVEPNIDRSGGIGEGAMPCWAPTRVAKSTIKII